MYGHIVMIFGHNDRHYVHVWLCIYNALYMRPESFVSHDAAGIEFLHEYVVLISIPLLLYLSIYYFPLSKSHP